MNTFSLAHLGSSGCVHPCLWRRDTEETMVVRPKLYECIELKSRVSALVASTHTPVTGRTSCHAGARHPPCCLELTHFSSALPAVVSAASGWLAPQAATWRLQVGASHTLHALGSLPGWQSDRLRSVARRTNLCACQMPPANCSCSTVSSRSYYSGRQKSSLYQAVRS